MNALEKVSRKIRIGARTQVGELDWSIHARRLQVGLNMLGVVAIALGALWIFCGVDHQVTQVVLGNPTITDCVTTGGGLILAGTVAYFVWTVWLGCFRYREVASVTDKELPVCSVVVPAYNEGEHVLETLKSLLRSDYPADKLELIAVNDGSADDTWSWIQRAATISGGRIRAINLEKNQGKRGALYAGFQVARGDVLVTVDSDSIACPDTLRRLVSPLARDAGVGCVAGNIGVLNREEGLIPKILDLNFLFSFDLIRAAQSHVRAVFCAPGALTAFRKSVIAPHLEAWLRQMFCGSPANIGEDRALTNIVLRAGYAVMFQRSSLVLTKVPTDYRGFAKMMIRWARSNVRENWDMLDFAFRSSRPAFYHKGAMVVNLLMQLWWMAAPALGVAMLSYYMVATLGTFLCVLLPTLIFSALLPVGYFVMRRGWEQAVAAMFYAVWGFLLMFWIAPYSLFSVHRSGWLTRQR